MKFPSIFSIAAAGLSGYAFTMWIAIIYLWAINVLTLLAFAWDKSRARRRKRRIPERRLLWLAALGGSPGALLGRWMIRHKTRKRGFSIWLLGIVVMQLVAGAVIWRVGFLQ